MEEPDTRAVIPSARERHERLSALVAAARRLDRDSRSRYLDQHCRDDPALRSEVESYLGAIEASAGLEMPEVRAEAARAASELLAEETALERPPLRVGSYRVEAEIGRGGMGVVFRGHDERLGRAVAIKACPSRSSPSPSAAAGSSARRACSRS